MLTTSWATAKLGQKQDFGYGMKKDAKQTCPRGCFFLAAHVCRGWYEPIAISVSFDPAMDLWLIFADPIITYSSSTTIPFAWT